MKLQVVSAASMAALFLVACGPSAAELAAAREKAVADSLAAIAAMELTYAVDPAASSVNWSGNMTGAKIYSHSGTIALNSGSMTVKGGMLTGGSFEVNMKGINPTDNGYNEEHPKEGLIGHLSSPDFFAVDSFPTASLKITAVNGNSATADLTLRGKTNSETITDIVVTPGADGTAKATGKLVIDRQKYGAAFPGPAKDLIIANNIELSVELSGKTAQ